MIRIARSLCAALAVITLFPCVAQAATCTWTGTISANWTIPGNWSGCVLPGTGDSLVFPDSGSNKAMIDDIADLSVDSINFPDFGGGYTLTGAGNLTITGSAAITSKAFGTNVNTLALTNPLKFGAATATIDTATNSGGRLTLTGPIDLNSSTLNFVWDSTVPVTKIDGVISGNGGITANGDGAGVGLQLFGNNTFTGPVSVQTGYLGIYHPNALGAGGSSPNGTTVHHGGTLLVGADTINETLTLTGGGGQNGNGMLQVNATRIWGGPLTLDSTESDESAFNLLNGWIEFAGVVSGNGGIQCCADPAALVTFSNSTNTFGGVTDFINNGGVVRVGAANGLSPNSPIVLGGSVGSRLEMQGFSATAAGLTGNFLSTLRIAAGQTLTVAGDVSLGDMKLSPSLSGAPAIGTVFKIIDKTTAGPISGTFNGLAEGAIVAVGGYGLKISYAGGDGNDVTLTVDSNIGNYMLSIVKPGSGSGTVVSNVGAISCGGFCSDMYPAGNPITLTASADAGSVFTGWLGPCTGAAPCTFNLSGSMSVRAVFAPQSLGTHRLDVDANGSYDALTDGLLLMRYLFGISGAALTNGALGSGAVRILPDDIAEYLNDILPLLDIDGNGHVDPLRDGVLIVRYLLGVRGNKLLDSAIGQGAIRTESFQIEPQIQSRMPP